MDRLTNPFRPGAGTRPPALLGRDVLIDDFGLAIQRSMIGRPGKSLMPIGLRGVGKTVLLNRFTEIAEAEGCEAAFIEAPEDVQLPRVLAARLRPILGRLSQGLVSTHVNRARGALASFVLTYSDPSGTSIGVQPFAGLADSGALDDDLTDLIVAVGHAARDRRRGLLIAIDEVQYLKPRELGALITAIHRSTQLDLPVVLVGAGLPQLPGLSGDAKSYAERLFDFPMIGSLSVDDATAAIAIPAENEGVEYTADALAKIVALSHGYPYFLQEWGYHTWNAAQLSPITVDVVVGAAASVQEQLDRNFFLVRFDRLTPKEKEYLRAMARLGPGPHRSGDIAVELGVRVESVAPRRGGLIRKGMIYSPAHGDTSFTVPLFDEYLLRAMP